MFNMFVGTITYLLKKPNQKVQKRRPLIADHIENFTHHAI